MKKTIRLLALVLALTLTLSLFASCAQAPEAGTATEEGEPDLLAQIRERGYIIVATEGDWSPWTYHGDDNRLTGFDVELAMLIAAEMKDVYEAVPACLCKHHGPFCWGKDEKTAAYNAAVLEIIAEMALKTARICDNPPAIPQHLLDKHYLRKHGKNAYYGQIKNK